MAAERKMELNDIVLIGRTYEEYYHMFGLEDADLRRQRILDAGSGVSSFCAEANARGINVTASDRIYCFDAGEIGRKCAADLDTVMSKLPPIMDLYKWKYFRDVAQLRAQRERAYRLFIEDYEANCGRYVETTYPHTGFGDKQFTLSLVSHFLFLYDEHLDYDFHRDTVEELIRITSGEVRIFPLVNLTGKRSAYVDSLMVEMRQKGYGVEIRKAMYEFIKGGDEMMVIKAG